jgi:predicted RNase H-like HicB family nuclease
LWYASWQGEATEMTRHFHVELSFEDELWIADCLDLPGCVSQGSTKEEAIANIREAIQASVETRLAHQLPFAHLHEVAVEVPA